MVEWARKSISMSCTSFVSSGVEDRSVSIPEVTDLSTPAICWVVVGGMGGLVFGGMMVVGRKGVFQAVVVVTRHTVVLIGSHDFGFDGTIV
jgi:hypothetical protein